MGQKEQKPLKRTKRADEGQIFPMKPSCSCADSLFTISDTECSEINGEEERRRIRDWARRSKISNGTFRGLIWKLEKSILLIVEFRIVKDFGIL